MYTKWDLNRLRAARKVVNRRLAMLEKAGIDELPSVIRLRAAFGGASRVPAIQSGIYQEEFEEISDVIYGVYNDVYSSSVYAAEDFVWGHAKMLKDLFRGIGVELSDTDVSIIKQYMPYTDFKDFLKDYIYENVVRNALKFIRAGIDYNQEYVESALDSQIKDVFDTILKDNGIEDENKRREYVEDLDNGNRKLSEILDIEDL